MAGLAVCLLLASAPALHATLPQLFPTFSTPTTITYVQLYGTIASPDDVLAETTLQGAYNQLQGTNRLYLNLDNAADAWWLTQSIPSTITVSSLSWTQADPDGALKAMLTAYGSAIKGYIICDPLNNPESCNMATTMAGINDAMVVTPDNLAVMAGYPSIPLITGGDLRTVAVPTGSQYTWVGSNSALVNNTSINQVSNPSGGSGTTGWATNCAAGQTLGTATYLGVSALEWTSLANEGTFCYAYDQPGAGNLTKNKAYVFSVQVAGSGKVYLDAWDGTFDTKSPTVTLNSTAYQTIQITIPVPNSDNSNPVQIQVRADTTNNAVTAYFVNAAVVSNFVAVDTYQYNNLIASTSTLTTEVDAPWAVDNRDYMVAAKLFCYYVGSVSADETALFGNILNHAAANTPVMGWIKNESQDVAYLSGVGQSHWLTTTNNFKNASVWASFPPPASYSQPAPAGIAAQNGHIYVSYGMSDGDNTSFMEGNDRDRFTLDQYLGAVPVGWTSSPSTLGFAPMMYNYFYSFLPQSNEMMAGPSGLSYETAETGADLTTFATLTNQFMTTLNMRSVNSWQNNTTDLSNFATTLNLPFVVSNVPHTYTQLTNTAGTVIDGQVESYAYTPNQNVSAIQSYVNANWTSGAPLFVNALADDASLFPSDMLYIAQQLELQRGAGQEYVFLTPAEMALTEANYHNSGNLTATSNAQAVPAATLLTAFPVNTMQNGSGTMRQRMGGGFSLATTGNHEALVGTTFLNVGCTKLYTTGTTTNSVIAQGTISNVPIVGGWYHFSFIVAGTGTAEIGVYNGSTWTYSSPVTLSSTAYQTIDVGSTVNVASGGLVQVILPAHTGASSVCFVNQSFAVNTWALAGAGNSIGSGTGNVADLNTMISDTYDYGPAVVLNIPANAGADRLAYNIPTVKASTQYVFSVDVAGSGQVFMDAYGGSTSHNTSAVTLGPNYQTLTQTITTDSNVTNAQLQVRAHTQTGAVTAYIRNASVTTVVPTDFSTGVETGQTQLTWTNTVDTTAPGGNESNVSSAVLQLTTNELSHGGSNAIQYGGTASGAATNYAYMEAFGNSTVLSSTSRLSYWIFPQSPLGAEPNASSTKGLNSTCVAVDIIFTNGTDLRDSGVTDQYGNHLHPAHQCNHLHPDQWNYVTVDLSSLSGKTISRIDVGYDQPNAPAGSYRGYIDDIKLTH